MLAELLESGQALRKDQHDPLRPWHRADVVEHGGTLRVGPDNRRNADIRDALQQGSGATSRIKTLTDRTREDNARFFPSLDAVPRHVVTQGVGTILEARHLVLLASGTAKAEAVARAVEGPVTAMVPGSALQLHPHVSVVVDEPAAACLALAPYYRETWAHKPPWQGL